MEIRQAQAADWHGHRRQVVGLRGPNQVIQLAVPDHDRHLDLGEGEPPRQALGKPVAHQPGHTLAGPLPKHLGQSISHVGPGQDGHINRRRLPLPDRVRVFVPP
jgi:hypothetical protein